MTGASIEEFELLSFFEVEPKPLDVDAPWPYNDYAYHVELGAFVVHFGINPAYRDVSLKVTLNGTVLYDLSALSVRDVRFVKNQDNEVLELLLSDRDSLLFQLRPSVSLVHRVEINA